MNEDKTKATEEMINNASGYPLFKFIGALKKNIGGFGWETTSRFMKLCFARARELNLRRFGDWEEAIVEVNHMPEPQERESGSLLPIFGYPCQLIIGKRKCVMISNGKLNRAYIRDFGEGQISVATAKKIFNS